MFNTGSPLALSFKKLENTGNEAFNGIQKQGFGLFIKVKKKKRKSWSERTCYNFSKIKSSPSVRARHWKLPTLAISEVYLQNKHYWQIHSFARTNLILCFILDIKDLLQMTFWNISLPTQTQNGWHLQTSLTIKPSPLMQNQNLSGPLSMLLQFAVNMTSKFKQLWSKCNRFMGTNYCLFWEMSLRELEIRFCFHLLLEMRARQSLLFNQLPYTSCKTLVHEWLQPKHPKGPSPTTFIEV